MNREVEAGDVLVVRGLEKSFPHPMTRKSIPVLKGIDLRISRGEIFGFLGPNGAGKTTTIKAIMGLIFPDKGSIRLLGGSVRQVEVKARIGFLPENPSFYEYLTGVEFLDFYGRLFNLAPRERKQRSGRLLSLVGLEQASRLPLRKYSKGMLQRIGLAQALINDPDFLLLDEPMSGLDPLGRRLVRGIIKELQAEGKTIFFTSHILSDAEMLCDRVGLIVNGRLRDFGRLDRLMGEDIQGYDVTIAGLDENQIPSPGRVRARSDDKALISLEGAGGLQAFLADVLRLGGRVIAAVPHGLSLEDRLLDEVERTQPGEEPLRRRWRP